VKKFALNLYIWPVFILLTLLDLLIFPAMLLANGLFSQQSRASFTRQTIRKHGWQLIKVLSFMAPVQLEKQEDDLELPAVFVANHSSAIDPYLFGLLPHENAFITSWPFQIPIFSKIMTMAEYIDTRNGWEAVLQQGQRLLKSRCSLIIWPEGHRFATGGVKRFKKGAFLLAAQSGRPIVPVCISGSGRLLPPGKILFTPSRLKLTVLPAIKPEINAKSPEDAAIILRDKARAAIEEELQKQQPVQTANQSSKVEITGQEWRVS